MNCEQANGLDMIAFLQAAGYHPARIRGADHWYHSPLHGDKTPSFKVNAARNTWYDFGIGKGGTLVDFVCQQYGVDVPTALAKIAGENSVALSAVATRYTSHHEGKQALIILQVKDRLDDIRLKRYLNQRHIPLSIAEKYCRQIHYRVGNRQYTTLGFKNNSGGYELRSPVFKGCSSPKFVTYFDNGLNTVHVFEGFFDFLSYQAMKNGQQTGNFLILNSLSFFTRSLLLIEKHERVCLWLDHDKAARDCVEQAIKRTDKINDQSNLYKDCKDLNDWWVDKNTRQSQEQRKGLHL